MGLSNLNTCGIKPVKDSSNDEIEEDIECDDKMSNNSNVAATFIHIDLQLNLVTEAGGSWMEC